MPQFLQFFEISKHFIGVTALDGVTLSIERASCHGIVGENGAGKSTLGRILAGIHRPDSGRVLIDDTPRQFHSPAQAAAAGVGMVHQELAFCPDLSVAENLSLGRYPRRLGIFLDRPAMRRGARRLLDQIGADIDVDWPMRRLSTAQEQLAQIATAVGAAARILVFDEPTSSLAEPEARRLFELIRRLKSAGVTIIYISHRMPEVLDLCDRISVLRDGRHIRTLDRADATAEELVRLMIGRSIAEFFPRHLSQPPGEIRLQVRGLSSPGKFQNIDLEVRAGEIVGIAGLVGAGRSEVARAIFGLDKQATGSILINGSPLRLASVRQSMRRGLGLLPEDRKRQGLVQCLGGRQNFSLAMLERFSRLGLIRQSHERRAAAESFQRLNIKTPSLETPVGNLSGGNQQKVALAKWLGRSPQILIVDEPTRGVDVGAKSAIHGFIDELASQGVAILLISSELPELLNLSSRILVMRAGHLVGQLNREQATQDRLLRLMADVG